MQKEIRMWEEGNETFEYAELSERWTLIERMFDESPGWVVIDGVAYTLQAAEKMTRPYT
jgi:hypothetical protein